MTDMLAVIEPKSDQINADDLIGRDMTITITKVQVRAGTEQPVSMYFEGSDKAFRPCKTVSRILVAGWGPDTSRYPGRSLTLYRDEAVKWGAMEVGGIRVSAMSDIEKPLVMALTATKGSKRMTTVQPLKVADASSGVEDARRAIADAQTMEALGIVWRSRAMGPFRATLQPDLDQRKAELSEPETGRADSDHGDQHDGTHPDDPRRALADNLITRCERASIIGDVMNVEGELAKHRDAMPDELVAAVEDAVVAARARIKGVVA